MIKYTSLTVKRCEAIFIKVKKKKAFLQTALNCTCFNTVGAILKINENTLLDVQSIMLI